MRSSSVWLSFVVFPLFCIACVKENPAENKIQKEARGALVRVHSQVRLGMTSDDVKSILAQEEFQHLSWYEHEQGGAVCGPGLIVRTPKRRDETHWLLFIETESDAVVAKRIRVADNYSFFPADAPEDVVVEGIETCIQMRIKYIRDESLSARNKYRPAQ